jgi:hypothetical protein
MSLPIGAIVRDLERALPVDVRDDPTPEQEAAIQAAYDRFDARYQNRPDYKLWRCTIYPYFAHRRPWLAGRQTRFSAAWVDEVAFARLAAESSDPIVFWSAVGLAPDLIKTAVKAKAYGRSAPIWAFVHQLHSRLAFEIGPLPHCAASCGITAATFLVSYHFLYSQAGRTFPLPALTDFANHITNWLLLADPAWKPGNRVDTSDLERERKDGRGRLRASHDTYEFGVLIFTLKLIGPLISTNINSLTEEAMHLLDFAYGCARSAWVTARSNRLWTIEHQKAKLLFSTDRAKWLRRKTFITEFRCLLNLSQAARNAGYYLEHAKFIYLIFRLIPDEFIDDPIVVKELRRRSSVYRYVKEAGLEVDPRFERERASAGPSTMNMVSEENGSGIEKNLSENLADISLDNTIDDYFERRRTISEAGAVSGYTLNIERDQMICPAWQEVISEMPNKNNEILPRYLQSVIRSLADAGALASPHLLKAGYDLARRYGMIRSAGKILARAVYEGDFKHTKKDVMDFVHSVRRCMALEPFGLRHEKIMEWRRLILDSCAFLFSQQASGQSWFSVSEKHWIHETLIARTHVHQKSLSLKEASRLYGKASGIFNFDDLREFYDQEYNFLSRPMNVATPETIATFAKRYMETTLGAPVLISVLCLPNLISLVAVGKDGQLHGGEIEIPSANLADGVKELIEGSEFWFRSPAVPFVDQIDWSPPLVELADRILDLAAECDATARVLILALEPLLAELPWQHLLCTRAASRRPGMISDAKAATGLLVSIVPSLSTITINRRDRDGIEEGIRTVLSREGDEGDHAVRTVVEAVGSTIDVWSGVGASVCVLVGHGARQEGSPLPAVKLGDTKELATIDDWMGVMRSRHMILHCCHSGATEPVFMHELGGVPGVGLSLGVEVFLAPVCEVRFPISVALQKSIFGGLGGEEVGVLYMKAIEKNIGVCLYNLYGNPYEIFLKTRDNASLSQAAAESDRVLICPGERVGEALA